MWHNRVLFERSTSRFYFVLIASLWLIGSSHIASAKSAACTGHFVNPITDICWSCLFPITLGSVPLVPSSLPDTSNPLLPVSACPKPPVVQVGLNIGYWEPYALVDVTRKPWCMVNLGLDLNLGSSQQIGGATTGHDSAHSNPGFYHAHWYKYPIIHWLQLIQNTACMSAEVFDTLYITEIEPLWDDDELSFILNPEAILFGNLAAQLACATEAMKTSTNQSLPIDSLFWCMGAQGSAYPLTGTTAYRHSPIQAATLIMQRLNYKLHRQGMMWDSSGKDIRICKQEKHFILPKSRYRYQMTNVIPDAAQCHPYTATTLSWESGHDNPVTGDNFGFMVFRKRNCVLL